MTITWYGQSCFKLDTREAILAIDPFFKEIGLTPPRFRADIVLLTHTHHDHANAAAIPGDPLLITGPGECEVKGITIRGISTFHDAHQGRERGRNTVFRIEADGITLVHLGDYGEGEMREETLALLGGVDILLIPVGGTYTIDGQAAVKVINQIEPRLVIPMHYHLPGLKVKLAPVDTFLRAFSTPGAEHLDKLAVKRKELPEGKTRVVVLNAGSSHG